MKVVGFERMSPALDEEIGSTWVIPPRHSAEDLREYRDLINKAESSPPTFDDGETAESQVRRKTAPRKKAVYDDDDEDADDGDGFLDDGEPLFEKNLPFEKLVGPDQDRPAKKRRVRRKRDPAGSGQDELPSDEEDEVRAQKARKRRKRELEKQRKIKSTLYISPSDDESDPERDAEFFAREEALRQRVTKALQAAPTDASQLQENVVPSEAIAETMRRLMAGTDDEAGSSGEDDAVKPGSATAKAKAPTISRKRKSDVLLVADGDEEDEDEDEDEETSSPPAKKPAPAPKKKSHLGFLVDSSDEEDEAMDDADPSSPAHATDEEKSDGNAASDDSDDEMETDDTPLSSNPKDADRGEAVVGARSPLEEKAVNFAAPQTDDGEEDDIPVATKRRHRLKGGFVMDDSDDE